MNFTLDQPELIKKCYDKHGVVIIDNVLSQDEIKETIIEIENIISEHHMANKSKFTFDDITAYPNITKFNNHGVIGKDPLFTKQLLKNRLNSNVQRAYEIVYDIPKEKLLAQHDRVAWMRPTIGPNSEDWKMYRTPKQSLHIDIDPKGYFDSKFRGNVDKFLKGLTYTNLQDFIRENNAKNITMGLQLQGVLNLFDNDDLDGGFHCALGGHTMLKEWFDQAFSFLPEANPNGRYIFTQNNVDSMFANTVRMPCKAGSLIIFDACIPHGTRPNYSSSNRLIQFLRYMPKSVLAKETLLKRKNALVKIFKENDFVPTVEEIITAF